MNKKKKIIVWSIAIFLLINIIIFSIIPFNIMGNMTGKHVDFKKTWTPEEFGLDAKHFFTTTEDGLNISTYEVAVDTPKVVIICLSGIQSPSVTAYFGHAKLFKEQGYSTILIDMRAHGKSDGDKICLGYKEHLDVKAVVQYIQEQPLYTNVPIVVMGFSMGAATAINSIGKIQEIDGLISLSAFSSWEEVFYENMQKSAPAIISKIEYPFVYLTTLLKYGTSSLIKPKNEIKKLGSRPALLMHSKEDSQVSYANYERLLKYAPDNVEEFVREGNTHSITEYFTEPEKDEEYSDKLLHFIKKYFVENR
ncbi:dipeptidyl aminopeptidase/acylaminoacyl peptidase [Parabacteroides sp. PFB2-10]|uniref:alpha/beta hydrolase n=1 Tax=Parabacteroides sp. PFB2-10 TaxID=1742405 RepID=UPI002473B9B2|nr:alpha/beta fold hydrolase [Parabacteroides sp. PFB2-10]MDH6312549.1 dipeptidyl aminopeptidase/acylaminoacyl peptidase [Parabacteroides sp. PFB2-10]